MFFALLGFLVIAVVLAMSGLSLFLGGRGEKTDHETPRPATPAPAPAPAGPGTPGAGTPGAGTPGAGTPGAGPGWRATEEVFTDPVTDRRMRVWVDETGQRHYLPELDEARGTPR